MNSGIRESNAMVGTIEFGVEEFRRRIQKLNEPVYVVQLKECRAEWRRRHPK